MYLFDSQNQLIVSKRSADDFATKELQISHQGRYILIVFETWSRQNGHRETADEHRRHST